MSHQKPISVLRLPPFQSKALVQEGFKTLADLQNVTIEDLAERTNLGGETAAQILRSVETALSSSQRPRPLPPPSSSQLPRGGIGTQIPSSQPSSQRLPGFGGHHPPYQPSPWHQGTQQTNPWSGSQSAAHILNVMSGTIGGGGAYGGGGLDASESAAAAALSEGDAPGWSTGSRAIDEMMSEVMLAALPGAASKHDATADDQDLQEPAAGAGAALRPLRPLTVLEIAGPPGVGKTCMAISLALSPWRLGVSGAACEAEVLFVDSEGGLTPTRLRNAAEAAVRESSDHSLEDVLGRMHLMRPVDLVEFVAFWHTVDEWLVEHPLVKLIVIDTLSFHLRDPHLNGQTKKRIVELIKTKLNQISSLRECAVVVTNQMATKLITSDGKPANFDTGDRTVLRPQLGETWMPSRTIKMILWRGKATGERHAYVESRHDPSNAFHGQSLTSRVQEAEGTNSVSASQPNPRTGDMANIASSQGPDSSGGGRDAPGFATTASSQPMWRTDAQDGQAGSAESGRRPRWPEFAIDRNGLVVDVPIGR